MQTRVQEAKETMEETMEETVRLSVEKRDRELHPGFYRGPGPVPRSQVFEHATGYVSTPPLGRPESWKRGHRKTVDGEYTLESPPRANAARPGMTLNMVIGDTKAIACVFDYRMLVGLVHGTQRLIPIARFANIQRATAVH
ncbi:hypothetical protein ColTof4_05573 [Colletotrichum tofieldiae]|nr:hypothetical protein ColTof4_05573 [Colletotrichum tofieldiae]GKT88177.1 hypothetical protein Ct61P_06027 [Colletotrichum tofieldiae]